MTSFRIGLALSFALVLAALVFGRAHHPHFWWDGLPLVWALLGYAGAWALVVGAKALAGHWLERDEAYYDDR